jgi:hypothetical protein
MQVFVSWSGSRSQAAARALYAWIEDVIQAAHPWMSDKDIEKGAVWFEEIYGALEQSEFGIISVTAERQHAPWVLFEAGALTKAMTKSRVCPVCIDLAKTEVSGPLAALNLASADNQEDMFLLAKSINNQLGEAKLTDASLERSFQRCWPEFEARLKKVMAEVPAEIPKKRDTQDILEEVLSLSRAHVDGLTRVDKTIRGLIERGGVMLYEPGAYGYSVTGAAARPTYEMSPPPRPRLVTEEVEPRPAGAERKDEP